MSLPYFYEPALQKGDAVFTLNEDTSKHCVQVLRMKAGELLHLTDGKGHLFTASILAADKKHTETRIVNTELAAAPARSVSIAISLLKNTNRFEWFLEKATEIGVSRIIPLICDRTERQHFRWDRMNNVLVAAMLQSQQSWLPVLQQPVAFDELPSMKLQQNLVAHCEPSEKNELREISIGNEVLMLIGPEGDFSPAEIQLALQEGFQPVSLGATRLRAETAGVVAATLLVNL